MRLSVFRRGAACVLTSVVLAGVAFAAHTQNVVTQDTAPPVLTPAQAAQLKTYLSQSFAPAHASAPSATATQAASPAADTAPVSATPDPAAVQAILALGTAPRPVIGQTEGLAIRTGVYPGLPDMTALDKQAADAVAAAFKAGKDGKGAGSADQAAQLADDTTAAAPDDPAMDERIALVQTLYHVDGTEDLLRHVIATQHMRLIIQEVNTQVNIASLSENDKYRLAAIAASAETTLQDKIILISARLQAQNLTKDDLLKLIVAFDIDAQRHQTQLRLADTGKLDRQNGLDVTIAQCYILKGYEATQP